MTPAPTPSCAAGLLCQALPDMIDDALVDLEPFCFGSSPMYWAVQTYDKAKQQRHG